MHLFKKNESDWYDFIFGRDFQQIIGINIINSRKKLAWGDIEIQISDKVAISSDLNEPAEDWEAYAQEAIKDAKYEKPDLRKVAEEQKHLTGPQKEASLKFLFTKEAAFHGKRGTWNGDPVDFEMKPEAKLFTMELYYHGVCTSITFYQWAFVFLRTFSKHILVNYSRIWKMYWFILTKSKSLVTGLLKII